MQYATVLVCPPHFIFYSVRIELPQVIMPNPEEMAVIGKLTKSNYAWVTEDSSTRLGEEELNPLCSDRLADLNLRPIPGVTPSANHVQR